MASFFDNTTIIFSKNSPVIICYLAYAIINCMKTLKQFFNVSFALVLAVSSVMATGSSTAHASSVYDSLISPTTMEVGPTGNLTDVGSTLFSRLFYCASSSWAYDGYYQSLRYALSQPNGRWGITVTTNVNTGIKTLNVFSNGWSPNGVSGTLGWPPEANFTTDSSGRQRLTATINPYSAGHPRNMSFTTDASGNTVCGSGFGTGTATLAAELDPYYGLYTQPVYTNWPINYPSGYAGTLVPDGLTVDNDGDGLPLDKEIQQHTSDEDIDTDGDGIDDLRESIWFVDRDEVFCDTTTSPYTCAYPDPTAKDIYVEVDWMQDLSHNFKPSATSVGAVEDGLGSNAMGYNVHIDTGEYGGGNALPYIEDLPFMPNALEVDYFDLKDGNTGESIAANFDAKRKGIWRYLISGYNFAEDPEATGGTLGGSENVFISYGLIEDNQPNLHYLDLDIAVAGTMIHELGHSLCLTHSNTYTFQSEACQFEGIDVSDDSLTYDSVLNYDLQMFVTRLSFGMNGAGDHDDWSAINDGGLADFSRWTMGDLIEPGVSIIHSGLSLKQARQAAKNGTLGKVKRGDDIYNYREKKVYNTKTGKVRTLKSIE